MITSDFTRKSVTGVNSKLKIAFVLDDSLDKSDGVQQYVLILGNWLSSRGHSVHYLVGETKRVDIKNLHSLSKNINVRFNGNRMSVPLPSPHKRIRKLLMKERFDIIHVQAPFSPFMAGRIIKNLPVDTSLIGTFHIVPYGKLQIIGNKLLAAVSRQALKRIDLTLSVSIVAQKFAKEVYRLDSSVIPNAVDLQVINSKIIERKRDQFTIVFLGRHVKRKGCMYLLKAFNRLKHRGDFEKLRLIIAGKGPLTPQLQNYITEHKLNKNVELIGYIEEIHKPGLLASADLAVFPSISGESFGIVLIEAMASGAGVVIGGDNPGYRCVLAKWEMCLFSPENVEELANRIILLIDDSILRKKLHQSQQKSVRQYDVNCVGQQIEDIYKSIIAKKHMSRDN